MPIFSKALIWGALFVGLAASAGAQGADVQTLRIVAPGLVMELDRDNLRDMGPVSVMTTTPWTEGVQEFTGVPLASLLPELDAGSQIQLTALNDYTVSMPGDAVGADYPVVAYERNSQPMSLRDKGPYWLIYPFDLGPEYQTETVYARSIWQLVKISVVTP